MIDGLALGAFCQSDPRRACALPGTLELPVTVQLSPPPRYQTHISQTVRGRARYSGGTGVGVM